MSHVTVILKLSVKNCETYQNNFPSLRFLHWQNHHVICKSMPTFHTALQNKPLVDFYYCLLTNHPQSERLRFLTVDHFELIFEHELHVIRDTVDFKPFIF